MAKVTSREQLKEWGLRKLGFPVIEINVDDDQLEDRIDEAFQFYFDYHYDAVERMFYGHEVTQADIDNGYIPVPDSLMHITRALPLGGSMGGGLFYPMGDPSLAWNSTSANPLASGPAAGNGGFPVRTVEDHGGAGSGGMSPKVGFYLAMASIEEFNQIFSGGETPIRFSRHTDRMYLDMEWAGKIAVGSYIVAEGWASLDPEVYTDVYNDRWLKEYIHQLFKQQWGANLIKYSGIQLPGGVTFDGDKLYEQATNAIEKLEEEMQLKYELPVDFYMG